MAQKKNLLPEQIYGDADKFVNNMGFGFMEHEYPNIQPVYGCPVPPYTTHVPQDKKLRKIKDILTVTEFEKIDVMRIIGFNKEELNEYIQLLIKVRDSGAYEEPEEVPEPEIQSNKPGITTNILDEIFNSAETSTRNAVVDQLYTINDTNASLTPEGDDI